MSRWFVYPCCCSSVIKILQVTLGDIGSMADVKITLLCGIFHDADSGMVNDVA